MRNGNSESGEILARKSLTWRDEKTEAVLITNHSKKSIVNIGEYTVVSKSPIRYLGVIIDTKLSFREHLKYAC